MTSDITIDQARGFLSDLLSHEYSGYINNHLAGDFSVHLTHTIMQITMGYKSTCDHCDVIVDKKYWTFNLDQCVVCDNQECRDLQREILRAAISNGVDDILESLHKNQEKE